MATCLSTALRMYPEESSANSIDLDNYVIQCMRAKGYRFSAIRHDCGHGDMFQDAACYEPQ